MSFTANQKAEVIGKFAQGEGDTGSARVQIALITARLKNLQEHFTSHKHDHHSRRGLLKLVGRRRRLLDYIKRKDVQQYRSLIAELGIRK